jgi:large subunit ribosomal protein L15e
MRRGGRKRPVAKGCPYGKPKSSGAVKEQKPERNLQSIAEVRPKLVLLFQILKRVVINSPCYYDLVSSLVLSSVFPLRTITTLTWFCNSAMNFMLAKSRVMFFDNILTPVSLNTSK